MAEYYPPPAFHFKVEFFDIGPKQVDAWFQSVSGLDVTMETEQVKEAGENRFTHELPVRATFPDLVLKRGFAKDSALVKWCKDHFNSLKVQPISVLVYLLDAEHKPLSVWILNGCWPKKWAFSEMNAEQNNIFIETFELHYDYFTLQTD